MGRECRRVPAGWKHPRDERGILVPLLAGSYQQAAARWKEGFLRWEAGERRDCLTGGWKPRDADHTGEWWEWDGGPPKPEDYMPHWTPEEATHYCMYETCSEGTPISPAFATPEEVARWCADNGASAFGRMTATYEAWLDIARGGFAPSAVIQDGTMDSGVEAMHRMKEQQP